MSTPTVVVAHLSDADLKKSINDLVSTVDEQTATMATNFDKQIKRMQESLRSLGTTKIDLGSVTDGGSSKRSASLKQEKKEADGLAMSYDKLLGMLQFAQRQERMYAGKNPYTLTREELDKYAQAIQNVAKYQDLLNKKRAEMTLSNVENRQQFVPNMKEYTDGLVRTSDELKKMSGFYKQLEKDSQRAFRVDFANVMKMPSTSIDEIRNKWAALKRLLEEPTAVGLFTPTQIGSAKAQLDDLWGQLSRYRALQEQINADTQQQVTQTNQLAEAEQKYGVEVARVAQYFRDFNLNRNNELGQLDKVQLASKDGLFTLYNPAFNAGAKSLEEQLASYKAINQEANLQLEVEKAINIEYQKTAKAAQESAAEQQRYNEQRQREKANVGEYDQLRAAIASVIGVEQKEVQMADIENDSYKALSATLKQLKEAYNRLLASGRKSEMGESLISEIQSVQRGMQVIQKEMARPVNLNAALNLPQNTLDEIAYKIQMLRSYAQGVNTEVDGGRYELTQVNNAIESLNTKSKELQKTSTQIRSEINSTRFDNISKMPTDNIRQIGQKIKEVEDYIKDLKNQPIVDEKNLKRAESLFDSLVKKADKLNKIQGTEKNVNDAMKMQANTLNEIAEKTQRLIAIRANLDPTKQAQLIQQVNGALGDLSKRQNEIMGKNQQMISSNNALARSWNYMKNRLAFYFTVGASTAFIKNLIEVRSQYEMHERALGILIDSAERGTQIFNELSQMALVSPYTLIELSNAAKQLTAYDVAAKDVVDTTRRLADMSSAVGIPIERLTYALGQIKAYGYLNSRDARMFLNAGIPLVKSLADHYTELEGKMVSVGDVYDRMKKKAIGYNDVMQVITEMTDEGGKFFDFQAKMADTLKVQLANLTLAWNNMLNDIGKSNQGILVGGIKGLKELFLQWKNIDTLIRNAAITFGLTKFIQLLKIGTLGMDAFGKKMVWQILVGKKLQGVLYSIAGSVNAIISSPLTWWALLATAVVSAGMAIYDADQKVKALNKSISQGGKENFENTKRFLEQNKELRESLYTKEILHHDNGKTGYRIVPQDLDSKDAEKAWVSIREQIELTSQSSDYFVKKLLEIDDVNDRVRKGFEYLQKIQDVYGAMQNMDDDTIAFKEEYSAWYNLGLAQDGVIGNLKEYIANRKLAEEQEAKGAAWHETEAVFAKRIKGYWDSADIALAQYRSDLEVTIQSMAQFAQGQGFDFDQENEFVAQSINKIVQQKNLGEKESLQFRLDAEETYKQERIKQFDEVIAFEQKRAGEAAAGEEKNRLLLRVKAAQEEKNAWLNEQDNMFGAGRVLFDGYTKYMTRQHMSEIQKMFGNMTKKEIEQIDWSQPKWKNWAEENAKAFSEQFGVSFDELRKWVNDANKMTIFIKTVVQKPDEDSLYNTLTEADKAADDAWNKIQRLNKRKKELESKGASMSGTKDIDLDYAKARKEIADAQEDYNKAIAKGGHSKKEDTANTKAQKQAESELQKALKDELSLIDKVRSAYKKLTKDGYDSTRAIELATSDLDESVAAINNTFVKFGLQKLDLTKYAGVANPREILDMLQAQLDTLISSGVAKPSEIKELQVKIKDLKIDTASFDQKKITDGLNNELSKIKDEYELAVELDANPELGDMFANMFGIDVDELPHTFGEAYERISKYVDGYLDDLKVKIEDFDLMSAIIKPDEQNQWMGLDFKGEGVQNLVKWQKTVQDMFKKNLTETEKALDDYVKKYGDYSDRIAEIEADRIEKIKRLNDAYYTEEMRKLPEYIAKLNAIEEGTRREKQSVEFDDFKNSRYYTQMFENLDHVSSVTLRAMRDRLREVIDTMNDLTPEQLKQVMSQYEKIEQKLIKRNPFKNLTKDLKEYIKTSKERKEANKAWADADKEYRAQKKVVATIKEKIKQEQAKGNTSSTNLIYLLKELGVQEEILKKLKEQVDAAEEKAQKYNLIKKLALEEEAVAIQMVAGNLSSLGEFRDTLDSFGINLGDDLDAIIDDLSQVGEGMNQIVSSAQSGNVVGVASGVVKTVGGLGDAIASVFGDGAARTKRLNREINKSKESVRQLQMAYKGLERAVDKSLGTAETQARREQIANKEAELAELQRQMELEQSKRSKDRDDDTIKQYQEEIQDLKYEIEDLKDELVNNLWGSDVKSAAESFVDTWVEAWRAGETTLDAMNEKMDEMIYNLIKKAMTSKIVEKWLKSLYDDLDEMTSEDSEGGVDLTTNELAQLAQKAGTVAEKINTDLEKFYGNLESLDIVSKAQAESKELSALQQGIQGITEETAGALEAYMNGVSKQVYLQSDILTQIRDTVVGFDIDVQTATQAQMLLQLQQSYAVQMAIQSILLGWSTPSGMAVRVEMQ